jgi:exonuclease SbcD
MIRKLPINHGPIRLLMTGDLHLGRASSRVPEEIDRAELRATNAWQRIVDLALAERASAVCLSGDIADEDNKFWEAIGPLERGIKRLAEAGIPTVAVAGNHDYQVLMRLADQLPPESFYLLGRGGQWERLALTQDGAAVLHIDGWSFPTRHVLENPVASHGFGRDGLIPHLGMVHGDLESSSSRYAPLDLGTLQLTPVDGWLLGHLHAPAMHDAPGKPWAFYPGSPQAFDPGETGAHGPWLAEVVNSVLEPPRQVALSSVWYAEVEVDLGGVESESECADRILKTLGAAAAGIVEQAGPACRYISARLRLLGATPMAHEIGAWTSKLAQDLQLTSGDVAVGVDKVFVETLPHIDLEEYARQTSVPGAIARMLLQLDEAEPPEDVATLIQDTRRQLEQRMRDRLFKALEAPAVSDEIVRDHLRTQGRAFLSQLVSS